MRVLNQRKMHVECTFRNRHVPALRLVGLEAGISSAARPLVGDEKLGHEPKLCYLVTPKHVECLAQVH